MGIKISPGAYTFVIHRNNGGIDRSEIRASNASNETRTARLEKRNAENAFF